MCDLLFVFFFKQKTAYEMRISDWSSDVCSSDLDVDDDIVPVPMDHDRFGHQRCFGAVEIFDEGGDPALVVKLHLVPFGMAGVDHEQSNAGIEERERQSGGWVKSVAVRVARGGGRIIKKQYEVYSVSM